MKYYGEIGFWQDDVEIRPGVFSPGIVPKAYTGDVLRNNQRWNSAQTQNDNLVMSHRISIVADVYLNNNLSSIKFVTYMGNKWKVNSIEVNYPRVIFELGGVYNGVDSGSKIGTT